MAISFLRPLLLLLLPAIALLWFLPRRVRDSRQRLIRASIFLALLVALAQPVLVTADARRYEVFVVDNSGSLSPAQRERARAAVMTLRDQAGSGTAASLVVIGDGKAGGRAPAIDASRFGATIVIDDAESASSRVPPWRRRSDRFPKARAARFTS